MHFATNHFNSIIIFIALWALSVCVERIEMIKSKAHLTVSELEALAERECKGPEYLIPMWHRAGSKMHFPFHRSLARSLTRVAQQWGKVFRVLFTVRLHYSGVSWRSSAWLATHNRRRVYLVNRSMNANSFTSSAISKRKLTCEFFIHFCIGLRTRTNYISEFL